MYVFARRVLLSYSSLMLINYLAVVPTTDPLIFRWLLESYLLNLDCVTLFSISEIFRLSPSLLKVQYRMTTVMHPAIEDERRKLELTPSMLKLPKIYSRYYLLFSTSVIITIIDYGTASNR